MKHSSAWPLFTILQAQTRYSQSAALPKAAEHDRGRFSETDENVLAEQTPQYICQFFSGF
jgi:hypothetical protein